MLLRKFGFRIEVEVTSVDGRDVPGYSHRTVRRGPYTHFGRGTVNPPSRSPVFDVFRENCYLIADSNHGYKMLGVGKLVASEILGTRSELLEPFRFARYAAGKLHPVSSSPFPWS